MSPEQELADETENKSLASGIISIYWQKASYLSILVLLLPIVVFLPNLTSFPYPASGDVYSDITTTHFPNAIFLLNALREWHQVPLWSPAILSGYPFIAHPLNGLFYFPGWLAFLFPLPAGFNLAAALHLAWGSIGMFRLMRLEGLSKPGAIISGLAFGFLPKLFAHYGAGHLTLMYAVPWTSWLLASQMQGMSEENTNRMQKYWPGIILGIILLADIRWGPFAAILWWSYGLAHSHVDQMTARLANLAKNSFLAFVIAAPLILPLLEYSQISTRAQLTVDDNLVYSLPPLRLLGLIIPDLVSNHEWVLYSGGTTILLATVVLIAGKIDGPRKFWLLAICASLVFSLGVYLPGMGLLFGLPGIDLLRVPSRALFLTGLGLSALAGTGMDRVLEGIGQPHRRRINLILTGLMTLSIGLGSGLLILGEKLPRGLGWGILFLLIGAIWILLKIGDKIPVRYWIPGIIILTIFELAIIDSSAISWRPATGVLSEGEDVAQFLSAKTGSFRTYSPSYSLPQHTAAVYQIELTDGVDPMQLTSYAAFMERASGVPRAGYHVTIPTYASGNPDIDNQGYTPDPRLLGLLNVRYVISAFDIASPSLIYETQIDETRIYRNLFEAPRAWIQPPPSRSNTSETPVEQIYWSPNRIELVATGPGRLFLSEIAYPGWRARVGGKTRQIEVVNEVFRSINLPEGEHKVEFSFLPLSMYIGFSFWAVALVVYVGQKIRKHG